MEETTRGRLILDVQSLTRSLQSTRKQGFQIWTDRQTDIATCGLNRSLAWFSKKLMGRNIDPFYQTLFEQKHTFDLCYLQAMYSNLLIDKFMTLIWYCPLWRHLRTYRVILEYHLTASKRGKAHFSANSCLQDFYHIVFIHRINFPWHNWERLYRVPVASHIHFNFSQ